MMRVAIRLGLLAPAFALATAVLGWWAVPVLGVVWGAVATRGERPVRMAATAAALGWAILLVWGATQGPVHVVARRVGPVLMLPGWLFVALTLLFPALLAASATQVAVALRMWGTARRND
jgi:hypothetical protein